MKTLIFAEKKSVGLYIADFLGASGQGNGTIENSQYIICWAEGHLVGLSEPQEQKEEWGGAWTFESLPMIPRPFTLAPIKKKIRVFKHVKEAFSREDVSKILVATDADREGELIFRYVYQYLGSKLPFERLLLTSNTPAAIKNAFNSIQPGTKFNGLAAAGWARSNADWLFGFNGTRAMTLAAGNVEVISIGRVQTPTLAMCVQRKEEVENFKSKPFWMLEGTFEHEDEFFSGRMLGEGLSTAKFESKEKADAARASCDLLTGRVVEMLREKEVVPPPHLYDLTQLQREANQRFGYTAKKTHDIAEELYDKHKAITYPRTDTTYLDDKVFSTITNHIMAVHASYMREADMVLASLDPSSFPRCVKSEEVKVHHAIIPSDKAIDKDKLPEDHRNVYEMICVRFLAALSPDAKVEKSRAIIQSKERRFKATGSIVVEPGWLEVEKKEKDATFLPDIKEGQDLDIMDIEILERKTTPPSHLTDSSLLAAMKTAGKSLENPDLAKTMKGKGLGTSATRDNIIETLISRKYLVRDGKKILATKKGSGVIKSLNALSLQVKEVTPLLSPEMTAQWEASLEEMSLAPKGAYRDLYLGFQQRVEQTVSDICENLKKARLQIRSGTALAPCPLCKGQIIDSGKSFRCSSWKPKGGCDFSIWKEALGTKISSAMAAELITKGETSKSYRLKNKAGKSYSARLKYSLDKKRVIPVFDTYLCPLCGEGEIREGEKNFWCTNRKGECPFTVWKSSSARGVTVEAIRDLVDEKATKREYVFDTRDGGTFSARLKVGKERIEYVRSRSKKMANYARCAREPWWI